MHIYDVRHIRSGFMVKFPKMIYIRQGSVTVYDISV